MLLLNDISMGSESSGNAYMMMVQTEDIAFVSISRSSVLPSWNLHELQVRACIYISVCVHISLYVYKFIYVCAYIFTYILQHVNLQIRSTCCRTLALSS